MGASPLPHERLVQVFDTMEESEAMVVKGLLESSGIPSLITALDAPQDVLPGVGGVVVRVPEDRAEEAQRLIAEFRSGGETVGEDTETPSQQR